MANYIYPKLGPSVSVYNSSSIDGWTAQNGAGSATIDDGFLLELLAAQNASSLYPDGNNPRYYKDLSSDIRMSPNWDLWVRIVSANIHSDSRLGISINNSSDTVNEGVNVGVGTAGEMFSGPFSNTVVGAPASSVALDGTGWIGISCRGGSYSALAGTGTSTSVPTNYASVARTTTQGQGTLTRLSLYIIKWAGADSSVVFDNVTFISR